MKNDNINKVLFYLVLIFIFFFSPIVINWLVNQSSPVGFINDSNRDVWIGFFGAIIGGVFTLLGVKMTIENDNKNRKADLELQRDYFEKNLRYEHLPALEFNMEDTELNNYETRIITISKNYSNEARYESKPIYISVRNLGANNAKNLNLQCVVDGYCDCGMQEMHKGFIKVEDCIYYKITTIVDQSFLDYFKDENSVSLSFFFTYEDIIGKVYRTRKQIFLNFNDFDEQGVSCMSLFMFPDDGNALEFIEPSSRMFNLSQKEIQKFDKQLKHKREENNSFVEYQSFINKKIVDYYVNIFLIHIIDPKLQMINEIIFDKYKDEFNSGYAGGPYYIDIKNNGNLVVQKNESIFYVHGLTIYRYTFDICINLEKEEVAFDNFKIKPNKIVNIINFAKIKRLSRNVSTSFNELSKLAEEKESD